MNASSNFLRHWFLPAAVLFVAMLFVGGGWGLYALASKPATDFYHKLGELSLQLAVIVVIGGGVKAFADWRQEEQEAVAERAQEKSDAAAERAKRRREFARRAREMHVPVVLAGELLRAHRSPKTYSEQLQNLIRLRFEMEDFHADLRAAHGLFENTDAILAGIDGILAYLKAGAEEYEKAHEHVASDWPEASFEDILERRNMTWTTSLMAGDGTFEEYEEHLGNSKGEMRRQAHGA